jgi:predicted metal-dependent hydrolase
MDGLPEHTVRVSARARRTRLVMSARDGLVVVVPRSRDVARVPDLLRRHSAWIERQSGRLEERRVHLAAASGPLPDRVVLPAVGRSFAVVLREGEGRGVVVRESPDSLRLTGDVSDEDAGKASLRRWSTRAARRLLVPRLLELADVTGGAPESVQIRAQRTRWGSCSASGTITLNRSLLYLTPELAEYVMLHELVHRSHLDHSPAYWRRLARFSPDHRRLRRELAGAWRLVPPWAVEPAGGGVEGMSR